MSTEQRGQRIKRLRKGLGLSQADFGRLIGRSWQSIHSYETTDTVSDEAWRAIETWAAENGYGDVLLGSGPPMRVRRVFEPAPRPIAGAGINLHALLDEVLQSEDPCARLCLENFLLITTQYLRRPK